MRCGLLARYIARVTDIERELTAITRRHHARRRALEEIESERGEAIRNAIAAKIPRKRIAELTGLSLQRIDQIRRGSRL